MGIFGKKKDTVKLNACYYSGDLEGFVPDHAVTITLTDTELVIDSKKARATLDRDRLLACEYFGKESEYTAKYKGHAAGTPNALSSITGERNFIVFTFRTKDGATKQMDFWCFALNALSAISMWKAVNKADGSKEDISL